MPGKPSVHPPHISKRAQKAGIPKEVSEDTLTTTDAFYQQVLENMKEGVSLSDETGIIIYTNSAEDEMFGYKRGELIGRHVTVQNTYSPDENQKIVSDVIEQLKKHGVWQGEFNNRKKDGSPFITSAKITALELDHKKYWLCVQEDITDAKRAADNLNNNEKRFRALIEHSADAIALTNEKGIVMYASTSVKKLLGYTAEEMLGKPGSLFVHPDDLEMTRLKLGGIIQRHGKALTVENRVICKDASVKWVETTATNLFDDPSVQAVVMNFRDVTERRLAEQALQATRNQLETALKAGTIATWVWDITRGLVYGDKNMAKLFGVKLTEVKTGLPTTAFIEAVHPEDQPSIKKYVYQVIKTGENYEAEYRLVSRRGITRWVIARGKVEYNAAGTPVRFPGVLMDITRRKIAEQKLRQSEKRTRAVFDQASAAMSLTTLDGQWIDFNRFYPKMFGYSRAALKKMSFTQITHPDDRAADKLNIGRLVRGEIKEYTREKRYIHKNGSIVHAIIHVTLVRDEDEQPQYIIAVLQDITQRKKAEERQAFLEKLSDTLFTSFEDNLTLKRVAQLIVSDIADYCRIVTLDEESNISEITVNHTDPSQVNLAIELYDGYKDDVNSTQGVRKILKTGKAEIIPVIDQNILDSIKDNPKLIKIVKQIGLKSYMGIPLLVQDKVIGAMTFSSVTPGRIYNKDDLAFVKEIGRRIALALDNARLYREAQKSHLEAENERQRLYDLFMQAPAAIGLMRGKDHIFEFTNPMYLELVGRKDNLIGKTAREAFPDVEQGYLEILDSVYQTGEAYFGNEVSLQLNGKHNAKPDDCYVNFVYQPFKDHNGTVQGIMVHAVDVTAQVLAKQKLVDSEERFRQLADSMPQMVWTARPDGYLDYYNKQWYEYTGLKKQAGAQSWAPILHPDDLEYCNDTWEHSVHTGEPYQIEYRFKDRSKPGTYRWFLGRALPIKNKHGEVIKWFGTCTDIDDIRRTIERKNELEKITAALTAQRAQLVALNKAKDEFISLASHQLRTPATGVKQYIGMTLEGYAGKLTPQQTAFLRQAYESNERQINIVNDLLRVAKIDAGKVSLNKQKIDLVALVESVIHEQNSKFSDRQQTVLFGPVKHALKADIDADRMRMVVENIIDNASKYTPSHRTIKVNISKFNGEIHIAVKDEGVGVGKKDLKKIFNKFSRIDNPLSITVGGTGLGLYWAKKIIDLHGGTIEVESTLGKGSTFTIKIPVL